VLNILLGFDLLPTSVLACTSVVCRLRTSQMRKADIIDVNDKIVETIKMENKDEKKFKNDLKVFICPEKNRDEHQVKYVDIYWPIPFLRVRIIISQTNPQSCSDSISHRNKMF